MSIGIPRFVGKPVIRHYLAADEGLKGKGSEHVEAEAAGAGLSVRIGLSKSSAAYNRAMLTMILSVGKLLRTFPMVLSPNVRKPANAITRHAIIEMAVE